MTGTSIHFGSGYVQVLATRYGVTYQEMIQSLNKFGEEAAKIDAQVTPAVENGDFEVIYRVGCGDDALRLDGFLEKKLSGGRALETSVSRISSEERKRRQRQFDSRIARERQIRRDFHDQVRLKLGLPAKQ